ncbi:MAG: dienelactone hydrolase family protein [bacterium]
MGDHLESIHDTIQRTVPEMNIQIPTPKGDMPAYLRLPTGTGPWPGVVVLHDALGMSLDAHAQADWLASEGFLALTPDLFHWSNRWRCLVALFGDCGRFLSDIDLARAWLAVHPDCTGKTGAIGFCMGGGFALMLADGHGFSVASVNYGAFTRGNERTLPRACPIVGSYGAQDHWPRVNDAPPILESALTAAGIDHDIKVYPEAGHGFMNQHGDLGLFDRVMTTIANAEYHEESTRDARARIVLFFRKHLLDGPRLEEPDSATTATPAAE